MVSHAVWKSWPEGLSRQKPRPKAEVFGRNWGPRAMFFTRHVRPWSNPIIARLLIERISEHSDKLNADIIDQELFSWVKGLKSGKSVYIDEISNEALKSGYGELQGPLVHLFNIIFRSGEYPNIWRDGFIIPIHKKNDIMNANNYSGIIISSCVAKLFLRIVTRRIEEFMKTSGRWSVNQFGFRSDHRTEDSSLIINTMCYFYVIHQNKPLYVAFVDFSNFFDKINRTLLLYKLLKCDITGHVYDIVKSMYKDTGYRVRVNNYLSPVSRHFRRKTRMLSKPDTLQYFSKWPACFIQGLCLWSCKTRN